jgi:hypothetical protein
VQVAVAALGTCVAQLGEQRDAAVSRIRERTTALVAFANAREAALMEDVAAAHRRAEVPLVAQRELLQVLIDGPAMAAASISTSMSICMSIAFSISVIEGRSQLARPNASREQRRTIPAYRPIGPAA